MRSTACAGRNRIGGLPGLIARSEANLAAIADWVARTPWIDFPGRGHGHPLDARPFVSQIVDPAFAALAAETQGTAVAKAIVALLEKEGVAYDIARIATHPPGLRIWAGATVERARPRGASCPGSTGPTSACAAISPRSRDVAMSKVLIADELSARAVEIFEARGIEAAVRTGLRARADRGGRRYDGLAVRSATKVTAEVLAAAAQLKVVGRAGIGVDNIDLAAATARGIVVMNTPYGNTVTTAEHAIAHDVRARPPDSRRPTARPRRANGRRSRFVGVELTGKTLGIIGCGNIGAIVADRAHGLNMKVIAYDPFLCPSGPRPSRLERVELDELFRRADFVTLHVPLTDETRNLINRDGLKLMKKGVRIVNCARGGLVDEPALRKAHRDRACRGRRPRCVRGRAGPGQSSSSARRIRGDAAPRRRHRRGAGERAVQVAEQMADFLLNGAIVNSVNTPSISRRGGAGPQALTCSLPSSSAASWANSPTARPRS